jgi:hypothetical protein
MMKRLLLTAAFAALATAAHADPSDWWMGVIPPAEKFLDGCHHPQVSPLDAAAKNGGMIEEIDRGVVVTNEFGKPILLFHRSLEDCQYWRDKTDGEARALDKYR